jgi:hypothetical protein
MKKTMNDIFDEAKESEMEHLVNQKDVPKVSAKTRVSIQDKVFAKTGLQPIKKKKGFTIKWPAIAVAACMCLAIGIMLFGTGMLNFDPTTGLPNDLIQGNDNTEQSEDNKQNNDVSGNTPADTPGDVDGTAENGGSDDDIVQSKVISEQGTLTMTIVKTEPSAPAFEENSFYARDEYGRCCRVIWSDFEGLSEEDRIVVQYRNLKRLTYKEYWNGGWTPPYELTAVSVKRVQEDAALPTLTVKSGVVTVLVGEPYDIWERVVEAQNYTHVYYESSHPSVASVDGVGQVTISDEKYVNIDVVAENEVGQTRVTVAIRAVFENPEVEVFAENVNLGIGEIYKLEEMIYVLLVRLKEKMWRLLCL